MGYKYEQPKGDVYNISIREWNKVFGSRGKWPFMYVAAYVDEDVIITHYYINLLGKVFTTILYPIMTLTAGYKEANKEVYRTWRVKQSGNFSSDHTYRQHNETWNKIEKLIGRDL